MRRTDLILRIAMEPGLEHISDTCGGDDGDSEETGESSPLKGQSRIRTD